MSRAEQVSLLERATVPAALSMLVVALFLAPAQLVGQDDELARRRAEVAEHPDDQSARCELAFALFRAGEHREAVDVATIAISALRARTDTPSARTLGACLYSRGRAHEALGEADAAIRDYADSVDRRPNDVVASRLATLVPNLPAAHPRIAIVAAEDHDFALPADASVTTARTRDRVQWSFVTSDRTGVPTAYAVARLCGALRVARVDEASFDNYGTLTIEAARPRVVGAIDAVFLTVGGAGDVTCGRMDGVMDGEHEATVVVFADGCEIHVARFVARQTVCDGRPVGVQVRFDAAGNATTSRRRGYAPTGRIGTFTLREFGF